MPQNLRALSVSNSSIALGWSRPAMANGVVKGYRLYYMRHNFTDVVTVRQTGSNIEYELHDLGKEARKEGRMGDCESSRYFEGEWEGGGTEGPSGSLPSRATFCLNIGLRKPDQVGREKLKEPFAVKANIIPSGYY